MEFDDGMKGYVRPPRGDISPSTPLLVASGVFQRAFAIHIRVEDVRSFREKAKRSIHYADVHIDIEGEIAEMTLGEFKARIFKKWWQFWI